MTQEGYFSVGELAHRVGVTVRTIQYYDQEGLLSPSAKGPQNQRLYSEENVKDLYRILTLKYLGLSLADIKSDAGFFEDNKSFHSLADHHMDDIEKSFQQLFKRLSTLRALLDKTGKCDSDEVDWEDLAQTIESCQDESQFFWRLTCIREDDIERAHNDAEIVREEMVSKWHELIADAIRLISEGEAVDSERNRDLAKRYLLLDESQHSLSSEQNFILMENIVPHRHGNDGSFDTLRETVFAHLEKVVATYKESQEYLSSNS